MTRKIFYLKMHFLLKMEILPWASPMTVFYYTFIKQFLFPPSKAKGQFIDAKILAGVIF